jgi:hypothetical protein
MSDQRSSSKGKPWLRVAIRASEFGVLASAHDLSPLAQRAKDAEASLQATQDAVRQSQTEWRANMAGQPLLDLGLDHQFRQFHQHLSRVQAGQDDTNAAAQQALDRQQTLLRQQLAQKNGLQAAQERSQRAQRGEAQRLQQREDDDTWSARTDFGGAL